MTTVQPEKVHILLTWHDHKGALWLHGNQAGAEDGGRISSRDPTHTAGLLQLPSDGMKGMLPEE